MYNKNMRGLGKKLGGVLLLVGLGAGVAVGTCFLFSQMNQTGDGKKKIIIKQKLSQNRSQCRIRWQ